MFPNFYLFADDTNIYFESSDLLTIQKLVVNQQLRKVRKWLETNRHKLTDHICLKIGRKKIKQETHVRFWVYY